MPNVIEIADLSLPALTPYARLTEAQLLSRRHPEQGLFIAESAAVIGCALDAGYEPVSFLMERRQLDGAAQALLAKADREILKAHIAHCVRDAFDSRD